MRYISSLEQMNELWGIAVIKDMVGSINWALTDGDPTDNLLPVMLEPDLSRLCGLVT